MNVTINIPICLCYEEDSKYTSRIHLSVKLVPDVKELKSIFNKCVLFVKTTPPPPKKTKKMQISNMKTHIRTKLNQKRKCMQIRYNNLQQFKRYRQITLNFGLWLSKYIDFPM